MRPFRRIHQHHWKNVACQPKKGYFTTYVLQRCDCGELCTLEVDGEWNDQQLGVIDNQIDELRQVLAQTGDR